MHRSQPSGHPVLGLGPLLLGTFSGGLAGLYFQVHRIFQAGNIERIPTRAALGFFAAAVPVFLALLLVRKFTGPTVHMALRKTGSWLAQGLVFAGTLYVFHVLLSNTVSLFSYDSILRDVLRLYPVFLAATLIVYLILKPSFGSSSSAASLVTFLLFVAFILFRTESILGVAATLVYYVYLVSFGRIVVAGLSRVVSLRFESSLETLLASFVCGILINYMLWYVLGRLSLLHPATVGVVIPLVSIVGLLRYGKGMLRGARSAVRAGNDLFGNRTDQTAAALLNLTLFCLVLLVGILAVKYPGSTDSSARMYCATIYKFASLNKIVLPPFFQHWPLLFQPMLMEVSGLPVFMSGGITALRFFNGSVYFSFIPFLILLCRKYDLPYRTIVIFLLLVVSSSLTFRLAYHDKPSALAAPAFISLLAVCLVMLKGIRPWQIVVAGALAAIIYNTKLALFPGVLAAVLGVWIHHVFSKPANRPRGLRNAVLVSVGILVAVCSLHAVQNIILRGNPFHPFAATVFRSSQQYPEELRFAEIPASFYKKTMPTGTLSETFMINLNSGENMYGPSLKMKKGKTRLSPRIAKLSISGALFLTIIIMPIIPLIRPERIMIFCISLAALSFYIWFGWIGDSLRYSTFLPCVAMVCAIAVGKPFLANRYLDGVWRTMVYGLLVLSVPLGLFFTLKDQTTLNMFMYLTNKTEMNVAIAPDEHPVTTYLGARSEIKPILLVADMRVSQYGFYQPNFLFQPIHWRKDLFTNMVYLATIRPTHLLTSEKLENSMLIKRYPFLRKHLKLETRLGSSFESQNLYRFDDMTPWEDYGEEYRDRAPFVTGHLEGIERTLRNHRPDPGASASP